jgi:hypothetical protein
VESDQESLMSILNSITKSRVWRSFFRHGWPDNPLDRSLVMTTNVFFHLHPVKVNLKSIKATYSLGLGVLTLVAFLSLALTGTLLMFYYVPSVERAFPDIIKLQNSVPFGQLLRNMHRWGAHLMVLTCVLHMARVFYTGAYKPPREFNWVVGVVLLILTLEPTQYYCRGINYFCYSWDRHRLLCTPDGEVAKKICWAGEVGQDHDPFWSAHHSDPSPACFADQPAHVEGQKRRWIICE